MDSLRYHRLHPEYIHKRIEALGHSYNLRILLLLCDIVGHLFTPFMTIPLTKAVDRTSRTHPRTHQGALHYLLS